MKGNVFHIQNATNKTVKFTQTFPGKQNELSVTIKDDLICVLKEIIIKKNQLNMDRTNSFTQRTKAAHVYLFTDHTFSK